MNLSLLLLLPRLQGGVFLVFGGFLGAPHGGGTRYKPVRWKFRMESPLLNIPLAMRERLYSTAFLFCNEYT
jgi:hypothetical protein